MNTILVPLDGSALAEQVLPYVRGLAPVLGARICLLRALADVENDSLISDGIMWAYGVGEPAENHRDRVQQMWDGLRQRAEGYLATVAMRLQESGLDVETEVRIGPPDEIIVEVARNRHVGLIMMATHGYGGIKRWTLGSVTDKVVHTACAPVFVVHGAEPAPPTDLMLRHILLPLDGSEFAKQALPLASELATCANAELLLLEAIMPPIESQAGPRTLGRSVVQSETALASLRLEASQELEELAGTLRRRQVAAAPVVVSGNAAEAIIDEAARCGADLIVMATHGYSGIKRWALGSVADKVLHATTTPLVLVRAQEQRS